MKKHKNNHPDSKVVGYDITTLGKERLVFQSFF